MESLTDIITYLQLTPPLSPDELAILDQHHIGGLSATYKLLQAMSLTENMSILDIGSGFGGPARIAASTYKSIVTGIDISPQNCEIAQHLSTISKTDNLTSFQCDSATSFKVNKVFDAAYMIHVSMCIKDKNHLIENAYRHLKTGAIFAIYDVFSGKGDAELPYPLPWTDKQDDSFLEDISSMIDRLEANNFAIKQTIDMAEYAKDKSSKALKLIGQRAKAAAATKFHLGENYHQKMSNINAALLANICAPHMIIAIKE